MAIIIKLSSARNVSQSKENLTYGEGREKGITITGTIYDASGIVHRVKQSNRFVKEDLSDDYYLVECSVTVDNSIKEDLEKQVADFFAKEKARGIFRLHAGLELECDYISKVVHGTHPVTGEPTEKVLATVTKLLSVEVAPDLQMQDEEEFVESMESARNNREERKTKGLAAYFEKLGSALFDNSSSKQAEEFAKNLEEKKKVGRPPKVKC